MKKLAESLIEFNKRILNESFIDYHKTDGILYEIHCNPSLSEVNNAQRFVGDAQGNLWCAINKGSKSALMFLTHEQLHSVLTRNLGKKIDPVYNSDGVKQGSSIALQRYPNTKLICLGESYVDDEINNINKKTWDKLIKAHPGLKFVFKPVDTLTKKDLA